MNEFKDQTMTMNLRCILLNPALRGNVFKLKKQPNIIA